MLPKAVSLDLYRAKNFPHYFASLFLFLVVTMQELFQVLILYMQKSICKFRMVARTVEFIQVKYKQILNLKVVLFHAKT